MWIDPPFLYQLAITINYQELVSFHDDLHLFQQHNREGTTHPRGTIIVQPRNDIASHCMPGTMDTERIGVWRLFIVRRKCHSRFKPTQQDSEVQLGEPRFQSKFFSQSTNMITVDYFGRSWVLFRAGLPCPTIETAKLYGWWQWSSVNVTQGISACSRMLSYSTPMSVWSVVRTLAYL